MEIAKVEATLNWLNEVQMVYTKVQTQLVQRYYDAITVSTQIQAKTITLKAVFSNNFEQV